MTGVDDAAFWREHASHSVDTPGCDCGHEGMGTMWHDPACVWLDEVFGPDGARRMWWWPAGNISGRWLPFRGGDEYGNSTIAVRVPFGMVIVALNVPLRRDMIPHDQDVPDWWSWLPWRTSQK